MMSIILEMPNADAEALLRFVKKVIAREQCPSVPWEASRLESALEALEEALEADVGLPVSVSLRRWMRFISIK